VKVPPRLSNHPPWRQWRGRNEMRDELVEMQGRIGELGREMARFATSPGMLSTMSSRLQPKPCPPPLRSQTYTTGLCLPHLFLRRPPPTRIGQPTIYPTLCHPRGTTTITYAIPNWRLFISLRLGSSRPRRALTTSISPNDEQLWIRVPCRRCRWHSTLSTRIHCRPSYALPATSSICSSWSAASADGIHVGGPSATA
jgi:hypothetical protein